MRLCVDWADTLSEQDASLAEKYLVRIWAGVRSTTTAETFDQLRVEHYTYASVGINALPPTSSVVRGHIHRGAFLVHKAYNLLETALHVKTFRRKTSVYDELG